MTAEQILKAKEPGDIFVGNPNTLKVEYRKLVKTWHPDVNDHPKAKDIMSIITGLYEKAEKMLGNGDWKKTGLMRFVAKDGKIHEVNFLVTHDFELGKMYIGNTAVTYVISSPYKDLFENAKRTIESFRFANDNMKKEMTHFLPTILATFETKDSEFGMVISKTPDLLLLRDVLDYYKKVEDRHVAWIENVLLNILCYIDYAKLSHNGISLDTFFISPSLHGGALLGGWWYSVAQGSKLLGAPKDIYSVMPPSVKNTGCGNIITDLESTRLIGRQLLGDANGTRLLTDKAAPEAMTKWLRGSSPKKATEDYEKWSKALIDSFGPRKFVVMNLSTDMVYPHK